MAINKKEMEFELHKLEETKGWIDKQISLADEKEKELEKKVDAVITKGYALPAKYVIHAVGPVWKGGTNGEAKYLTDSYNSSLELAKEKKLNSISFPLISSGIYGYPKEEALQIAISSISKFLLHNDMDVYLVVFDRKAVSLSEKLFSDITSYIHTYYEDMENTEKYQRMQNLQSDFIQIYEEEKMSVSSSESPKRRLEDVLNHMDETFSPWS